MRTKILISVALGLGIASLVLMILNVVEQETITLFLVLGLICISLEFLASKKDEKNN